MDADYNTKANDSQSTLNIEGDYYYKQEMSKLTDGSENDCADGEFEILDDPFSDDEIFEIIRDRKLKRDLAGGRNLNNSFGQYDASEWDHLH